MGKLLASLVVPDAMDFQRERELLKLDEELAQREACASFLQYCRHPDLFPGESQAAHYEFMINALGRVTGYRSKG